MILVLFLGIATICGADKLDRTYLPPPGSKFSGGSPDAILPPIEYTEDTSYSSTTLRPQNFPFDNQNENVYSQSEINIPQYRPDYVPQDLEQSSRFSTQVPPRFGSQFGDSNQIGQFGPAENSNVDSQAIYQPGFVSSQASTSSSSPIYYENGYNLPSTTTSYAFSQTTTYAPLQDEICIGANCLPETSQGSFIDSGVEPQISISQQVPESLANIPANQIDASQQQEYTRQSPNQQDNGRDRLSFRPQSPTQSSINTEASSGVIPSYSDNNRQSPRERFNQQNFAPQSSQSTISPQTPSDQYSGTNNVPSTSFPITSLSPDVTSSSDGQTAYPIDPNSGDTTYQTGQDTDLGSQNRTYRPQADTDRNAVIVNYENVITPEGFSYSYDTSNGIHADESGTAVDGVKATGGYSYTGDDGKFYSIEYSADENGYQPRGDHLPTPPPIPEAILRVIEETNRAKAAGILDDGLYDEQKYGYKKYEGAMDRQPSYDIYESNESQPQNANQLAVEEGSYDDNSDTIGDLENVGPSVGTDKSSAQIYADDRIPQGTEENTFADNVARTEPNYYSMRPTQDINTVSQREPNNYYRMNTQNNQRRPVDNSGNKINIVAEANLPTADYDDLSQQNSSGLNKSENRRPLLNGEAVSQHVPSSNIGIDKQPGKMDLVAINQQRPYSSGRYSNNIASTSQTPNQQSGFPMQQINDPTLHATSTNFGEDGDLSPQRPTYENKNRITDNIQSSGAQRRPISRISAVRPAVTGAYDSDQQVKTTKPYISAADETSASNNQYLPPTNNLVPNNHYAPAIQSSTTRRPTSLSPGKRVTSVPQTSRATPSNTGFIENNGVSTPSHTRKNEIQRPENFQYSARPTAASRRPSTDALPIVHNQNKEQNIVDNIQTNNNKSPQQGSFQNNGYRQNTQRQQTPRTNQGSQTKAPVYYPSTTLGPHVASNRVIQPTTQQTRYPTKVPFTEDGGYNYPRPTIKTVNSGITEIPTTYKPNAIPGIRQPTSSSSDSVRRPQTDRLQPNGIQSNRFSPTTSRPYYPTTGITEISSSRPLVQAGKNSPTVTITNPRSDERTEATQSGYPVNKSTYTGAQFIPSDKINSGRPASKEAVTTLRPNYEPQTSSPTFIDEPRFGMKIGANRPGSSNAAKRPDNDDEQITHVPSGRGRDHQRRPQIQQGRPSTNNYREPITPQVQVRGEDFTGPRQPPRFDPETGYHY